MLAVHGAESLKSIMLQAIRDVTRKRYLRIESFNDYPHTRHEDVLPRIASRPAACGRWLEPDTAQAGQRAAWSAFLEAPRASLSHARASSHPLAE